MVPSQGRLIMRLFDLASGRCLRATSCAMPGDEPVSLLEWLVGCGAMTSGRVGSVCVQPTQCLACEEGNIHGMDQHIRAAGQQTARPLCMLRCGRFPRLFLPAPHAPAQHLCAHILLLPHTLARMPHPLALPLLPPSLPLPIFQSRCSSKITR
jgi:hypothetical protein